MAQQNILKLKKDIDSGHTMHVGHITGPVTSNLKKNFYNIYYIYLTTVSIYCKQICQYVKSVAYLGSKFHVGSVINKHRIDLIK